MKINYGKNPIYNPYELYVIGDIHGEYSKLCSLLNKITSRLSYSENHLVFCGDYCNRLGENSPGVFEKLIELKNMYPRQVFCLKGNHEEMLISTLKGNFGWISFTKTTLEQMALLWEFSTFGNIDSMSHLAKKERLASIYKKCWDKGIIKFLEDLLPYYESEKVICTHAPIPKAISSIYGLRGYKDSYLEQAKNPQPRFVHFLDRFTSELQWEFISEFENIKDIDKFLICGHQFTNSGQPRLYENRAFVDTGCGCVPNRNLMALKFPGRLIIQ